MRDVFIKLRIKCSICRLRLKFLKAKILEPFLLVLACINRYWALRKINKESKDDRWERYVKIKKLERSDELAIKREQFQVLKTQVIGAFYRTSICTVIYIELQEQSDEIDNSQKDFQKNKEELVNLLEKFCDYDEIIFDEKIKSGIIGWDLEKFKTQDDLNNWTKSFTEYIGTLDIV